MQRRLPKKVLDIEGVKPSWILIYLRLGLLNDLWRYRMNDSTWTWMSGSNTIDQRGVYGELGVYTPGARQNAMGWYDSNTQELWLFGGNGFGTDICAISFNG